MFHVFLSHRSEDKPAVEHLARRLRDHAGLNPFLDTWNLVPGAPWQPALEQALADSETAAVFFGPSGRGPWHSEELQLALLRAVRRRDDFRLIPVLLPGATPEQLEGFLELRTWVDFRDGLDSEAAFARLVAGIQGRAPTGGAFTLPDAPAPYRGLLAFDEAHSAYFFGREPDIERTLEKLGRERFVAVVGPSGSGKSSLVLGGVLPRLRRPGGLLGPELRTWTLRPGGRPLRALADALAAGEPTGAQRLALSDTLHQRFLEHPDGLCTAVASLTADRPGPCVLVVDQLEELFTHAPGHGAMGEVEPFVANLRSAALQDSGPLRILVTLRADFFDRCLGLDPLRELLQDRQVLLGSLGEEALRDVILRPAQKVGAFLEKGLLTAILKDLSREPGALPLLEDALDQLWRARQGAWLTLSAYEASGGISQTLQRRAQACYEALPPEEREVARQLLVRLTSLGEGREDTRRRIPRAELTFPGIPKERVEHVLRALSGPGARLIVMDQGSVEVAHEVLIRTWPTLRKWLEEDRRELRVQRRLAEASAEWNEHGRKASYLYGGARLLDAEELFRHKPALLNQLEREFLEASTLLRDQQRREEEERTQRERESAVLLTNEKRTAFSRELVIRARQSVREDPQRALLLLQEAQRLAPVDTVIEILDAWSQERCLRVLRAQRDSIIAQVSFGPNGPRVLITSLDGSAHLWEASSGKRLLALQGKVDFLIAAVFSPDGSRLLTTALKAPPRLWDASTGKLLTTLEDSSKFVPSAAFSPDGSHLLAVSDGTVLQWDASTGKLLTTLAVDPMSGGVVASSPNGTRILIASDDGTARLWDAFSGKRLLTLQGHSGTVLSATFSPDGSRVLTASKDTTARLWDASSGTLLLTLQGHSDTVVSATFSSDSSRVLTASEDTTTRLWDASSGTLLLTLQGHSRGLESALFSPDGSCVLTSSRDNTARLWDVSSSNTHATLLSHSSTVVSATFSPDGSRALTASYDESACLWDVSSGTRLATFQGHSKGVVSATFSPDGSNVLTASEDTTARLWDTSSGKHLLTLRGHSEELRSATFSPDGSRILTASDDSTARLWDASSGTLLLTLQGHSGAVVSAAFSPDGSRVLTASKDTTARLWDTSSGTLLLTLQGHSKGVVSATFSPDGSNVLTASKDTTARLWDTSSGKHLLTFQGYPEKLQLAIFSPDGSRILTASDESTACLWDASSGTRLLTLRGDGSAMLSVTFNPESTRILTATWYGAVFLWDASSGKRLSTLLENAGSVWVVKFSPDGSRILTASMNGTIRLWPSWRWDPDAFAKLDVGRKLTLAERRTFLHEDLTGPEE